MSVRAIVLGVLVAVAIAAGGYINDQIFRLNQVVGSHFPIIVFGPLIGLALLVNPLLARLGHGWKFRPAELAMIVTLAFAGCAIPGSGLMRFFSRTLGVPIVFAHNETGWRKWEVMSYVPPQMLPGSGGYDERVANGFMYGLGDPDHPIGIGAVPWAQWQGPLVTWMPIVALLAIASICLSLVVHRQWVHHERLRYPVVDFMESLLGSTGGQPHTSIIRNKLFWAGLALMMCLHLVNGAAAWFPNSISIPLSFDLWPLVQAFPVLAELHWRWQLLTPALWPIAVAFAFFLASDIGLSLGVSQIFYFIASAACFKAGLHIESDTLRGGIFVWERLGGSVAFALILIYVGRRYYWQVVRQSLGVARQQEKVEPHVRWAFRILIASIAGLVALFVAHGLDWTLAIPVVLLSLMVFLVLARLNAEAGLILVQVDWTPMAALVGLLGLGAIGPQNYMIVALLICLTTLDPRECLLPFLVNGFKIGGDYRIPLGRIGVSMAAAFLLALAVAIPVGLWADYNFGVGSGEPWATNDAPRIPFDSATQIVNNLAVTGELEKSEQLGPLQRIAAMEPGKTFLWSAGAGVALVLLFSIARLRFAWWPLHPLIFIIGGTWATAEFMYSFLFGWLVKTAVMRLGGIAVYRQAKVFMIGVIAGDLLGGLIFMVIGMAYRISTGIVPPLYRIMPGG
ncbi:MAG: DUF6785 family protein [Phycisphaerae bacterium]|jgi:hypothetical protein